MDKDNALESMLGSEEHPPAVQRRANCSNMGVADEGQNRRKPYAVTALRLCQLD